MKNVRGFGLGLALGIGFAFSSIGLAQTATQSAQTNKTESCCAMESCCKGCKGESCSMNHEINDPAQKDHARKDHAKMHAAMQGDKDGCCCCGGDSCEMKMTHDMQDKPKV